MTFLGMALPAAYATPILWTGNGHEYTSVSLPDTSWNDSKANLQSTLDDGWYLATITSQQEQDWIQANVLQQQPGFEFWLGGFQFPSDEPSPNAGWTWVTGEPWSYTNWATVEPNDNMGPGSEQFLAIHGTDSTLGFWNDELGNSLNINGYLAERTAPLTVTPEPASTMLFFTGAIPLAAKLRKKILYKKRFSR